MLLRAPGAIQETLETMVAENDSITQVFILNNQGNVSYSSDKAIIGTSLDRYKEESCRVCHTLAGTAPDTDAPTIHDLIVAADEALYAAKHQGRNRVVLSEKVYDAST